MTRVHLAIVVAVASTAAIGCSAKQDAPTSAIPPAASRLAIAAARIISDSCRAPGETIAPGPTVLVTDSSGVPVGKVSVSFQVLSGNGTLERGTATTDANGLASAGAWTLGSGLGVNAVRAFLSSGDTSKTVSFSASTAIASKVVAVFQLTLIGGQPLPLGSLTGGHYYLGANGTYSAGYEYGAAAAPTSICSSARFTAGSSGIDFYLGAYPLPPFYQQRGGLFAVGTLSAASMSVNYEDTIDFSTEVYTLAAGSVAPLVVNNK